MNDLVNFVLTIFVSCMLKFIRCFKWLELKCLNFFGGYVENRFADKMADIGAIWETNEINKCKKSDAQILKRCNNYYDTVCRIQLINKSLIIRAINRGYIAVGEAYMNGDLKFAKDDDITEFLERGMTHNYNDDWFYFVNRIYHYLEYECVNLQTPTKAWEVGRKHYDLGNKFFASIMDSNMQYSSGYWANATNLEDAQIAKMQLIAKKLYLKPGMRILDLGCGWGTLCKYFAENYGVECVGVTVSKEGYEYATRICSGLPVKILLTDYRQMNEKFDRVYSIEMLEHVGYHNHRDFFKVAHRCLKDDGIFLVHSTIIADSVFKRVDPYMHTYVFPNLCLPYAYDICKGFDGLFVMEDWHNMTMDMSKSMIAWRENVKKNWHSISDHYDDRLYRMYIYFTSMASAAYNTRKYHLAQIVLSKTTFKSRYITVR